MNRIFLLSLLLWFQAVSAQERALIRAIDPLPRQLTVYSVTWTADREIAADAAIGVVFPRACNLSQVIMADSRQLNGGLMVNVSGDTVWVQRSGLGEKLAAGDSVEVKIASVFNPVSPDQPYEFKILLRDERAPVLLQTLESEILREK
ncbi:MAG TPA: hypothetical protein PKN04_08470 [bacterium]|jgi:hypothetical protein|nr:hypothetical protein [bacterium]HNT65795.1 hypothetical protein [bacterium]